MTYTDTGSMLQRFAQWFRVHLPQSSELAGIDPYEAGRIAREIGMTTHDLAELEALGPHAADLMPRRLATIGVEAGNAAHVDPATLRDLQRVCAFCMSKGQCRGELDAGEGGLPDYCPNAETLRALFRRH
jgi:hypothetical protein